MLMDDNNCMNNNQSNREEMLHKIKCLKFAITDL